MNPMWSLTTHILYLIFGVMFTIGLGGLLFVLYFLVPPFE